MQRLWATASIYATVISWLYAVGALFSVLQDPVFRRILHESRVERAVRRMREPFHLICGYDDAGSRVVRELTEDGRRSVVVEIDTARADAVDIEDLTIQVPALAGDASDPKTLMLAGLTHSAMRRRRRAHGGRPCQHQDRAHRAAPESRNCRCCARCATTPRTPAWRPPAPTT